MSLIVFYTRLLKKIVCSTNRSLTSSYLKLKVWIFEANSKCFVEFQQNKSVSEMTKIKQIISIESFLKLFALLITNLRNKVFLISLLNLKKKINLPLITIYYMEANQVWDLLLITY